MKYNKKNINKFRQRKRGENCCWNFIKEKWLGKLQTSHSLWPWSPSWLRVFTATVSPVPGFTGAVPFSSIHPLNTQPKPPSPRRLSGLKFLVANLRSLNENFRRREATLSSSSSLEVDELLSALLVVEDGTIAAAGWSLLVSLVNLPSAEQSKEPTYKNTN